MYMNQSRPTLAKNVNMVALVNPTMFQQSSPFGPHILVRNQGSTDRAFAQYSVVNQTMIPIVTAQHS